ncbi:hypothetical protein GCM10022254_67680 [Actinomadura meridiana]|uniref:Uncharacterized protein n=1 Tax=Actinomadura meridiana TaxID=559626 RepID=A0ABP8CLV1_9ACTN
MFSSAVSIGSRLNDWNTNPSRSRRSLVSAVRDSFVMSTSPMSTEPDDTASNPAMQCRNVDLPDPEGPMIAVNLPRGNVAETPRSAVTAPWPAP